MARIIIRDSIDIELPSSIGISNDEKVLIKDSVLGDSSFFNNKALSVIIDATHCGYFNQNSYFYTHDGMASGVASFVEPYLKPILTEHEGDVVPMGRVKEAAFIPIPEGTFDKHTDEAKYRGVPTGKIRLTTLITDVEGIQRVLRAQYLTVSTGGAPVAIPYCSACNEPVTVLMGRPVLACDHVLGELEKDKYVGMVIPQVHYDECSFINHPADYTSQHSAGVISMDLVDYDYNSKAFKTYDSMVKRELIIFDGKNKEDKMEDEKNKTDVTKDNVNTDDTKTVVTDEDFNKMVEDAIVKLDECEGCDEDISVYWKDVVEDELAAIVELDSMLDSIVEMSMEDALSKEKRKSLKTSVFCGPNKTFPVDTCARGATALAMLNWPKVVSKYSASTRAKIKACIMRKGKTMDCKFAVKTKDVEVKTLKLDEKYKELEKEYNVLKKANDDLKQKLDAQGEKTKASDNEVVELNKKIKDILVNRVIELSIYSKQKVVDSIRNAENDENYQKAYDEYKTELMERSKTSLEDKIKDLKIESKSSSNEVSVQVKDNEPAKDEGVDDPFQAAIDKRKSNVKKADDSSVEDKLFPDDGEKDNE